MRLLTFIISPKSWVKYWRPDVRAAAHIQHQHSRFEMKSFNLFLKRINWSECVLTPPPTDHEESSCWFTSTSSYICGAERDIHPLFHLHNISPSPIVHPPLIRNGGRIILPLRLPPRKQILWSSALNADETLLDILPKLLPEVLLL